MFYMFNSNSWKSLPKWQYLVAYHDERRFKIMLNKSTLPTNVMGKLHAWERYETIVERLRATKLIVDEIPKYITLAKKFKKKGKIADLDPEIIAKIPYWNSLYEHQKTAVAYGILDFKGRVYLADEMGSGKTYSAITILNYLLLRKGGHNTVLILCPASLQKNWKTVVAEKGIADADVHILSYDKAKNVHKDIKANKYDVCLLDEAHCLKDTTTQRYRKLAPALKRIEYRILLSGTPCVNRADELYSPLSILYPKLFKSKKKFMDRYFNKISRKCRLPNEVALMMPLFGFIRRTKNEVLNLPPKVTTVHEINDKKATVSFKVMLKKMQDPENMTNPSMMKYLIGEAFHSLATIKAESRAFKSKLLELLQDTNEKTTSKVVFCIHKSVVECLKSMCEDLNISHAVINGETVVKKRGPIVAKFQAGEIDVLICSIQAAGVGLTMTRSNNVILAESSWVPGLNQQAIDRCHRIGQTKKVYVDRVFCNSSIDQFIQQCEKGKKKMHKLLLKHLKEKKANKGSIKCFLKQ